MSPCPPYTLLLMHMSLYIFYHHCSSGIPVLWWSSPASLGLGLRGPIDLSLSNTHWCFSALSLQLCGCDHWPVPETSNRWVWTSTGTHKGELQSLVWIVILWLSARLRYLLCISNGDMYHSLVLSHWYLLSLKSWLCLKIYFILMA